MTGRSVSGSCRDESRRHRSPGAVVLIGLDSDGCVFDSMTVKQCRHFHPLIIRFWQLEPIAGLVRETAEFVNLFSAWRGRNRFESLLRVFDLLAAREEAQASGLLLPDRHSLRAYVASGVPLGHPTLADAVAASGDAELKRVLDWSRAVNHGIAEAADPMPPFDGVRESLEAMAGAADMVVVSQTPSAALEAEWHRHGLGRYASRIMGQEAGSKAEQLRQAMVHGGYAPERVLMLGDAPGDLEAAREAGVRFFPVIPGREVACWRDWKDSVWQRFREGTYAKEEQDARVGAFLAALPEQPGWTA